MDDYINKKFKFYVPLEKKAYRGEDGRLYIDGVASNTDKDYEDDQMDNSAIASMKKQSLAGLTGFDGHDYSLDGIFGRIVALKDTANNIFHPVFQVRKSMESKLEELIDDGYNLGLSIGGVVKDFTFKGTTRIIKDLQLFEVSITPIPTLGATLGTVGISDYDGTKKSRCPGPICTQILKSIDTKYFESSKGPDIVKTKQDKVDIDKEDISMEDKDIESIVNGVAQSIKDSNTELINGITEALKPEPKAPAADPEPTTTPAGDPDPEENPEPALDKSQIVELAKAEILKEMGIKITPEVVETDEDKTYKSLVKALAGDVMKEVIKSRPHQRKDGPTGTGQTETVDIDGNKFPVTKKTQTRYEAAEKLQKMMNPLNIARA